MLLNASTKYLVSLRVSNETCDLYGLICPTVLIGRSVYVFLPSLFILIFLISRQAKLYLKAQQTATKLYKVDSKGGELLMVAVD